jgi:hypothetical protein
VLVLDRTDCEANSLQEPREWRMGKRGLSQEEGDITNLHLTKFPKPDVNTGTEGRKATCCQGWSVWHATLSRAVCAGLGTGASAHH